MCVNKKREKREIRSWGVEKCQTGLSLSKTTWILSSSMLHPFRQTQTVSGKVRRSSEKASERRRDQDSMILHIIPSMSTVPGRSPLGLLWYSLPV